MRAVKRLSAVLMVVVFVLQGMATAADFSPKIGSKLSTRKVMKNSAMMIHVEQEAGEEELAHVTLGIPAGFRIPKDAQVEDGDVLGSGQIFIEAGTACSPGPEGEIPASTQVNLPATLEEVDRTDEEADGPEPGGGAGATAPGLAVGEGHGALDDAPEPNEPG